VLLTKRLSGMKVLVNDIAEGTVRLLRLTKGGSAGWKTSHDRTLKMGDRTVFRAPWYRREAERAP